MTDNALLMSLTGISINRLVLLIAKVWKYEEILQKACVILNFLSCVLYGVTLYFLPQDITYAGFMVAQGVIGIIGLMATFTKKRILTVLYIIGQSLMIIPVWTVIGFVIDILMNYKSIYCGSSYWYYCNMWYEQFTPYQRFLYDTDTTWLWIASICGAIGTIVSTISIAGFRKLRIFQLGKHKGQQQPVGVPQAPIMQQPGVPTIYQPQPVYAMPPTQQPAMYQMPVAYGPQQGIPQQMHVYPHPYPTLTYPRQGFEPPPAYVEPEVVRPTLPVEEPKRHSIYA